MIAPSINDLNGISIEIRKIRPRRRIIIGKLMNDRILLPNYPQLFSTIRKLARIFTGNQSIKISSETDTEGVDALN
jgi:hypothetical protein